MQYDILIVLADKITEHQENWLKASNQATKEELRIRADELIKIRMKLNLIFKKHE